MVIGINKDKKCIATTVAMHFLTNIAATRSAYGALTGFDCAFLRVILSGVEVLPLCGKTARR